VLSGRKLEDKEFLVLTELLMMQLLKLDGIEAEGEARVQRKAEVQFLTHMTAFFSFITFYMFSGNV
jgi:hypothetical protein